MRLLKIIPALCVLLLIMGFQGSYRARQQKIKAAIEKAYKNKKLTPTEYKKLKDEQLAITRYIHRAEADGQVSPAESKTIHAKLQRAGKRLVKYQKNREVY